MKFPRTVGLAVAVSLVAAIVAASKSAVRAGVPSPKVKVEQRDLAFRTARCGAGALPGTYPAKRQITEERLL
jgi:hypothetical protein